jgi:hypothetical protein
LKDPDSAKEKCLDFVSLGLDFRPPDLDFVALALETRLPHSPPRPGKRDAINRSIIVRALRLAHVDFWRTRG